MAKLQFDAIDTALLVTGIASASMLVGIASFNLFDVEFAATVFSPVGIPLSTAWVLGYGSVSPPFGVALPRSRAASHTVWRGPQAGSYNRLARTNGVILTTLRPTVRPRCGRDCDAGQESARPSRPRFPHRSGPTSRTRGSGARDRPRRRGLDGSRSERVPRSLGSRSG